MPWRSSAICLVLVLAPASGALGQETAPDDVQRLADAIDRFIAARWNESGVQPSLPANDEEFLRRTYLDVAGKIPTVSEARTFLDDPAPNKRRVLIDRLVDTPAYIRHFTNVWRKTLLSEAQNDFQVRFLVPGFEAWLAKQLAERVPYDRMVRELLTAPRDQQRSFNQFGQPDPAPAAFYEAKEQKPENLGAATARLFLGLRVECAQCHDHPFGRWKREEFWRNAAFFSASEARAERGPFDALREAFDRAELEIPGTPDVVEARFLDGAAPEWRFRVAPRQLLADWITSRDNPYFARTAVNRLWAWFFGTGLVDPPDDFDEHNPPSHPELLDELARGFAGHDYDLRFVIRAIASSRTYQLGGTLTHPSQEDPRMFARMAPRGLAGEQLFDSMALATGYREPPGSRNPYDFYGNSPRKEFLTRFAEQVEGPTQWQTSILQALTLMNGRLTSEATSVDRSELLVAVAECPLLDTAGRIETLYLAALGRRPRPDERERLAAYVASGGPRHNAASALADVFWALLNSSEFLFNH
jgi:hypothetical protein